jgi:hypothetical protein
MRVHVNDPQLVKTLLEFLEGHDACVAAQVSESEVEVSLLESYRLEAHRRELDRLLRVWEAEHPGAIGRIVREGPSRRGLELA